MTSSCTLHTNPHFILTKMHHQQQQHEKLSHPPQQQQPDPDVMSDVTDFEFVLDQPVNILPADQLFSDSKLFPVRSEVNINNNINPIINGVSVVDSFLLSPKATKVSSYKWKELLNLKKLYQNNNNNNSNNIIITTKPDNPRTTSSSSSSGTMKSIKQLIYRSGSKPPTDNTVNLPLLNETENETGVVPSRHSLSSTSSGHDQEDLPRISLDTSEKQSKNINNMNTNVNSTAQSQPRMKLVKTRTLSTDATATTASASASASATGMLRTVSTESPRMNSSGKIVFQSLERSSSSPSSFNGGVRLKNRGIERSYSGNVRITPVLNVPVCSLRGFPLFSSSSQKHEGGSSNGNNNSNSNGSRGGTNRQQMNNKSKSDRS